MKMSNDEFIQFINSHGGVKDVIEAFKEYPPEEEWHKGKIENILKEDYEVYSLYSVGDIVFVNTYQYEDSYVGKNHLFVIISQNNLAVPIENFGMLLSSNLDKLKYDTNKLLKKDSKNKLNKDSIVKTDVIYSIDNESITFKIGSVDQEKVDEYIDCYIKSKENAK